MTVTPGGADTLGVWTLDAPVAIAVIVAAALYVRGVARVRAGGDRWPLHRAGWFGAGLVVVLGSTGGPLGGQARALLWAYTIQVCLLLLVAPILLGAGSPLALAWAGAGDATRGRLARAGGSFVVRAVRAPGVGPLLMILVTVLVFFTPATEWSLRSAVGHDLLEFGLLAVGLALALPITDQAVTATSIAYAAMLGLGFVEFLLDAVPGIALRLLNHPIAAEVWLARQRVGGPSAIADQHLAGSWLWFWAEAGDLPFLGALLLAWMRADAREARIVDADLDRAHADRADADRAQTDPAVDSVTRPWWETDPAVFGEERARRNGWGR